MDPDAALAELRKKIDSLCESAALDHNYPDSFELEELREQFEALDEWLMTGGHLPKDWQDKG